MSNEVRGRIAGVASALAVISIAAAGFAQAPPSPLVVGGRAASAGIHALRAGFTPDPFQLTAHPTGTIDVAQLRLGAGCRGFVSAQPDVILRYSGAAPLLRLFARASSDITLIVHGPNGRFSCNDDSSPGQNTNPMVDLYSPRPGQYDVWIGTHAAGPRVDATLFATAQREQRP